MYYFKCSNCGFYNHVTSEYLIFCGSCGKKLQITYRDWHTKNPDKNLNDFHELFCIQQNDIEKKSEKVREGSSSKMIFSTILLVIALLTLLLESLKLPALFLTDSETEKIKSEKWREKQISNISIEIPFSLVDAGSNIRNQVVENFKSYAYTSEEGFEMLLTILKYTENVAESNLPNTSYDPIVQMQENASITGFKYLKRNTLKNKVNGILYEGSFFRSGEKFEFIEATYAQKSNLWQLILVYKPDSSWDKHKAYRIYNSLIIKQSE